MESLGEFAWAEVFSIFDVATGQGVVGGIGASRRTEGNVVAAENDGPVRTLMKSRKNRTAGLSGVLVVTVLHSAGAVHARGFKALYLVWTFSTLALCAA